MGSLRTIRRLQGNGEESTGRQNLSGSANFIYFRLELELNVKKWVSPLSFPEYFWNCYINFQFRVRAVNKEGESDPLTTDGDEFLAKNPYNIPEKVDKPEIVDWDKDHVDLQWKIPDDGGSPIEQYVVEIKDKYGKWTEAMRVRIC